MGLFIMVVAAHHRLDRKHELMLECYMESSYSLTECITLITITNNFAGTKNKKVKTT